MAALLVTRTCKPQCRFVFCELLMKQSEELAELTVPSKASTSQSLCMQPPRQRFRRFHWTLRNGLLHAKCRTWPRQPVPDNHRILYFDGAARGNPGPAGAGAVLFSPADAGGEVLWAGSVFVGISATNNTAEYSGAILGVRAAAQMPGLQGLHCIGDSNLVVKQTTWQ